MFLRVQRKCGLVSLTEYKPSDIIILNTTAYCLVYITNDSIVERAGGGLLGLLIDFKKEE